MISSKPPSYEYIPNTYSTFIIMDINYRIPKVCPCGWNYFDSVPKTHMYSNAHNFALVEKRKAVKQTTEKSTKGDCEVCNVKNLRNLERHFLTNAHIRRYDSYTTHKFVEDRISQLKLNEAPKDRAFDA